MGSIQTNSCFGLIDRQKRPDMLAHTRDQHVRGNFEIECPTIEEMDESDSQSTYWFLQLTQDIIPSSAVIFTGMTQAQYKKTLKIIFDHLDSDRDGYVTF